METKWIELFQIPWIQNKHKSEKALPQLKMHKPMELKMVLQNEGSFHQKKQKPIIDICPCFS